MAVHPDVVMSHVGAEEGARRRMKIHRSQDATRCQGLDRGVQDPVPTWIHHAEGIGEEHPIIPFLERVALDFLST